MLNIKPDEDQEALIKRIKANEPPGGYKDFHAVWYLLYLFGSMAIALYLGFKLADIPRLRGMDPIALFSAPFIPLLFIGLFLLMRASKNLNKPK